MNLKWTNDINSVTYNDALAIRYKVFVDEQKVPVDLEIDDYEDSSLHLVLYEKSKPVATARIYEQSNDTYKVQRVAVLKEYRTRGIGTILMREIEKKVKMHKADKLTLGSQNTAIPFYEKLGYKISSTEFMDAGIPHHSMTKSLS